MPNATRNVTAHVYHGRVREPRNNNNGGLEFQFRKEEGGQCAAVYPPQPLPAEPDFPVAFTHVWLKLVRRGDTFTAMFSRDATIWKTYSTHSQDLPKSGFLGLAVTAHNDAQRQPTGGRGEARIHA